MVNGVREQDGLGTSMEDVCYVFFLPVTFAPLQMAVCPYCIKAGLAIFLIFLVISPTRWESQENGNVPINVFYLALNQFPFDKAFYVTYNFIFRHEIKYPFVERDHCLYRCVLNCLPTFINCFRFNNLREIFRGRTG